MDGKVNNTRDVPEALQVQCLRFYSFLEFSTESPSRHIFSFLVCSCSLILLESKF